MSDRSKSQRPQTKPPSQPQPGAPKRWQQPPHEDEQGSPVAGSTPQSGSRRLEHDQDQDMEGNKTQRDQEDKLGTDKDRGGPQAVNRSKEERQPPR
jgi:hypothetical protein